jgi:hypothetical protein
LKGNLALTSGIYEEDDSKIMAEIILLIPPYRHTIDVTEGVGISQYIKRKTHAR